jgi:hypothetical protein
MKYPVFAAFLGACVAVQAQNVISWNVDANSTISGASQYAGVVSAPYWNNTWASKNNGNGNATGSSVTWNNLFDNTGANSGVSVTSTTFPDGYWNYYSVLGSGVVSDANGTYNNLLLNGYDNYSANNITISAIPYAQYDLYVYFTASAAGRAGTLTVGSTTYDFSTMGSAANGGANAVFTLTTDTTGANPSADYAVFSGLTGSSQTLAAAIPDWGGIAGWQIVEEVPEPGTMALAGMGGLALLQMKRRFKKS